MFNTVTYHVNPPPPFIRTAAGQPASIPTISTYVSADDKTMLIFHLFSFVQNSLKFAEIFPYTPLTSCARRLCPDIVSATVKICFATACCRSFRLQASSQAKGTNSTSFLTQRSGVSTLGLRRWATRYHTKTYD